jgi:hypothetical protein
MTAAVERVVAALAAHGCDPTVNGHGVKALCPVHGDRHPSLDVAQGERGALLVCRSHDCAASAIVEALGLTMADLFDDVEENCARRSSTVVARYPYTDEHDELLYTVVRWEPGSDGDRKSFAQVPASGQRGKGAMEGVRRVLYRLPEVLRAVARSDVVYVVEGEKDADTLVAAGYCATTNASGAGKWRDDYSRTLAGASVVVVADRDHPGYQHARQVHDSLVAHGCDVRVVEAATGKDAADHLGAGFGVADFAPVPPQQPAAIGGAPARGRPDEPGEAGDGPTPPVRAPSGRLLPQRLDWNELFATPADPEWLIDYLWPAATHINIHAEVKAGKSILAFYLATCLGRGIDPWTHQPRPPVIVGYLDYEMGRRDVAERVEEMGLVPEQLGNVAYFLSPDLPPLDTRDGGRDLSALCQKDALEALVIDTIGRCVKGEEETANTWFDFWLHSGAPLKAAGIPVLRLDHVGHTVTNRPRGSSGKEADVDIAWTLKRGDAAAVTLDNHGHHRQSWVPDQLALIYVEEPHTRFGLAAQPGWPAGTAATATDLDRLGVPLDASRREAEAALRATGHGARHDVVLAALKWRRSGPGTTGPDRSVPDA